MADDRMATDQAAQGSTVDYCSRWPEEGHSWSLTKHAGLPVVWTKRCGSCGFLDVSEVRADLAALTADRLQKKLTEAYRMRNETMAALRRWKAEHDNAVDERDAALAERDRLREKLRMAQASERAALAAEAGRATPVIATWEQMRQELESATISEANLRNVINATEGQRDAALASLAEAKRVIRNAHQAIRKDTTAAAVALAMFDTRDQHGPSLLDELETARASLAAEREQTARMRVVVANVRPAWRGLKSSLVAVAGVLDKPYPDAPEWTPWTRFVTPAVADLGAAVDALDAGAAAPGAER